LISDLFSTKVLLFFYLVQNAAFSGVLGYHFARENALGGRYEQRFFQMPIELAD